MKENISVEAGKCGTHSLNETFRSVIRQVIFLRGSQVLPHLGKQLFAARRSMSGEDFCARKFSQWSGASCHVANDFSPRNRYWYPQSAWENPSL
jgi:hypothetical protein